MPGLTHGEVLLTKALREFRLAWGNAALSWRDQARTDFEQAYVDEFVAAAEAAVRGMERINRLLEEVIRECR